MRSWLRLICFSIIFALTGLFLVAIEPFGIDSAVEQRSQDVAYRILAPVYGGRATSVDQFDPYLETDETLTPPQEVDRPWIDHQTDFDGFRTRRFTPHDPARDKIATIFMNEYVLRALRNSSEDRVEEGGWEGWRPSYQAHDDMVYSIGHIHRMFSTDETDALAPPPSIFFDFTFLEDGGGARVMKNFGDLRTRSQR